jgi:O-antigen ligase
VFQTYAPRAPEYAIFEGSVYVAHSIYFQMLGEHGFVGLALFLSLGVATWLAANRLARRAEQDEEYRTWMPLLMRMVQVSLIGYGVGGAFLSLAYLDIPYYIVSYVLICQSLMKRRAAAEIRSPASGAAIPATSQPGAALRPPVP